MVNIEEKGLSIKELENLKIGDIKRLDKEFKKNIKVKNIKLVKSYGREVKL